MTTPPDRRLLTFLDAVGRRLSGPAKLRAEIVAELNDGLLQAVHEHRVTGVAHEQAVDRALAQFGEPDALARSFAPELAAARARRTAIAALLSAPIVTGLWIAAARSRPLTRADGLFDGAAAHIAAGLPIAALILACAFTIVTTGRGARWLRPAPETPPLGAAATAFSAAALDIVLLATLSWRLAEFSGSVHELVLAAAILASATRALVTVRRAAGAVAEAAAVDAPGAP
jgi:hypothetical protein